MPVFTPRRCGRCGRALRAALRQLRRHLRPLDSTRSATRSAPCRACRTSRWSRSGSTRSEALLPNDKRVFHGFDLLREYFMFPRKFLGFRLINLDRVLRTSQGQVLRPDLHLQCRQSAPAGRGAGRPVRALHGAGHQPVHDGHRPDPGEVEPARISRRAGPQPLARLRAAAASSTFHAHYPGGKTRSACRRSMRRPARARRFSNNLFYTTAPPAAPPDRRGEEVRRVVGLHGHRRVPVAGRARRRRATTPR